MRWRHIENIHLWTDYSSEYILISIAEALGVTLSELFRLELS